MINDKFAKKYFPEGRAVGHRVGMGSDPGTKDGHRSGRRISRHEVRGDAGRGGRSSDPAVRTTGVHPGCVGVYPDDQGSGADVSAARHAVQQVDATLPVVDMQTLENQVDKFAGHRTFGGDVIRAPSECWRPAGVDRMLYGVMAYTVARRTREIGIRMALGAGDGNVVWLVMKEVLVLVGDRYCVGLAASWGLTRYVQKQRTGFQPNDLMTIVLATIGIACVCAGRRDMFRLEGRPK